MIISKATSKDLSDILTLQYNAYESEAVLYNDFTIPPMTQTLDQIKEEATHGIILKAVIDEVIIGSVRATSNHHHCEVGRLIVHPDFQRQGIGTQLLSEIETYFPDALHFNLFTGTKSKNNLRLYKRNGYVEYKTEALNDRVTLIFLQKESTKQQ